jgi:hypothetical protein
VGKALINLGFKRKANLWVRFCIGEKASTALLGVSSREPPDFRDDFVAISQVSRILQKQRLFTI